MGDEGSNTYMTGSTSIIRNFDYDALEELRAEVTKREDGINCTDFVSIMAERLPHLYDYDKGLASALRTCAAAVYIYIVCFLCCFLVFCPFFLFCFFCFVLFV